MDFLKNIAISLQATGPAAVIITWIIGITCVGVFGEGDIATKALYALQITGPMLIMILGQKVT